MVGGVGPAALASMVSAVLGLAYLSVPSPFGPGSQAIWVGFATYVMVCAILIATAHRSTKVALSGIEAVRMDAAARESVLRAKLQMAELAGARGVAERRLEQVTDALPVLISQVGADGRFEFVNRAYEEWFGRGRENLKGRHLEEVLGPDLFSRMKPRLETVLSGTPVSFEETATNVRGERREMRGEYIPNISASGEVVGYFALIQDVTETKRQSCWPGRPIPSSSATCSRSV
jgi:PAS domain S-box-containing protein